MSHQVSRAVRVPRDPRDVTIELRRPRDRHARGPRVLRLSRSTRAPHGPALRRLADAWARAALAVDGLPPGPSHDAFEHQLLAVHALVWRLATTVRRAPAPLPAVDEHLATLADGLVVLAATAEREWLSAGGLGHLGDHGLRDDVHAVLDAITARAAAHEALAG